ncbi:MAG TPA: diguanylate cyclase [Rhodopseudomonas sp.]|uniref:diguanylate cyclase domain-containing protein n=1 Tax=Rhodopseudomonas sp. TaxID=1078 RepID=UPI002ED8328E
MSRVGFYRKKAKLKGIFGIRARLVLLALILVGPLMVERIRSLEDTRVKQVSMASSELSALAERTAASQREIISSVEAVLKSSAYIHASASRIGRGCATLRASLRVDLPSIRMLMVAGPDGIVRCSTSAIFVGLNISDRTYFKKAIESHDFVVSDFLVGRQTGKGTILAAYPVSAIDGGEEAVLVAGLNLDWMSGVMGNLGGRPGVTAALIDGDGIVLATPPDQMSLVGQPFVGPAEPANPVNDLGAEERAFTAAPPSNERAVYFAPIRGTTARLVVAVDEAKVSAGINREIRTAYLQLALVCFIVLLGALIAAERLIVKPVNMMTEVAKKFGQGDWSARVSRKRLPAEFVPLARAFNAMAAHLVERERGLVAINNRLTVMASIDVLSGLANRRGFQSRLDFEWMKAEQNSTDVGLLMIDVDHFKPFNDTYGHPEGDACISRIGETLATIANDIGGFAARYGGEEFCLLLAEAGRASEVGEMVRSAVAHLAIPHRTSIFQQVTVSVGVARTVPHPANAPRDLIEAADAALYAAKHRGRNAVVEHGFLHGSDSGLSMAS